MLSNAQRQVMEVAILVDPKRDGAPLWPKFQPWQPMALGFDIGHTREIARSGHITYRDRELPYKLRKALPIVAKFKLALRSAVQKGDRRGIGGTGTRYSLAGMLAGRGRC